MILNTPNCFLKIYTLVIIIIISSCHLPSHRFDGFEKVIDTAKIVASKKIDNSQLVQVNIPSLNSSFFDYEKELKDVRFIPLQTTAFSKIGQIDDIFFTNDRIFVVDATITQCVFIFDLSGKFVARVGATDSRSHINGLTHFFSATCYYQKDQIILHDDKKELLYYYDRNGKYIKQERAYISFTAFSNIKNTDKFVYMEPYDGNKHLNLSHPTDLYLGGPDGRITNIAPNAIQRIKIGGEYFYQKNLSPSVNRVFYTPTFSDTTYEIGNSNLDVYPKFVLRFPGKTVNQQVAANTKIKADGVTNMIRSHKFYSFDGRVLIADSMVYFNCLLDGQLGYFYSTKTNKAYGGRLISNHLAKDSVFISFYQYPIASTGNEFVSLLEPDYFDFSTKDRKSKAYSEATKNFNKNSNPIVVLYKIKPF